VIVSSSSGRTGRFFASFIDHPRLGVAVILLLSLLAAGGYLWPSWPKDLASWWNEWSHSAKLEEGKRQEPQASDAPTPSPSRGRRRGSAMRSGLGQADAILVARSPHFFTPQGSESIRKVVAQLEALPSVASVQWLDQTPPVNIFGLAEPVLPRSRATQQRFDAARNKATQHPLVVGQSLSPDAETLLLAIRYNWIHVLDEKDSTDRLLETAQRQADLFPESPVRFSITGPVPIRLMMIRHQERNQKLYQLIGYGMVLAMAMILFRGLSVVFTVALAPIVGVLWTLGILRYFQLQLNPFSDVILPVLLSLVGFTDGVHMIVHIRRKLSEGRSAYEACRQTLEEVGMACFLTSLTTAIGMGSLVFANHQVVREFGTSCVLGVTLTWISVMLVIPLICRTGWSRRLANGTERNLVDGWMPGIERVMEFFLARSRWVSLFSILLLGVLGAATLTLRPDDRRASSFPSGSPEQQTLHWMDESMGGLDQCRIELRWNDSALPLPKILGLLEEVEAFLKERPLVGHPLSIARLLTWLPGDQPVSDKSSMIALLPPPLKSMLFDEKAQRATISFRVQDLGTRTYQPIFEEIESMLRQKEQDYPGVEMTMEGEPIWRWRNLYQIVTDLVQSLGSAAIVIFGVMALVYRSLRIGIISVIPNLLPLAAAGAWMAATGQPLEIVSVCAFTVCLGIAVDDTIHFLSRYQLEQSRHLDRKTIIRKSFSAVGSGLVMTTLVLLAGFSSVLFSDTRDHRVFASLGAITIAIALVCDLLLLPCLLNDFDRPSNPAKDRSSNPPSGNPPA
jgi:predicted RND superfamily exporter protein